MKQESREIIKLIILILILLLLFCINSKVHAAVNLEAIGMIESSNNPFAISPAGINAGAGQYQVSKALLDDYNRINKENIQQRELFNPVICRRIALWAITKHYPRLISHYGCEVSDRAILSSYNIGAKAYARTQGKVKVIDHNKNDYNKGAIERYWNKYLQNC